jgi:hypothetical protein
LRLSHPNCERRLSSCSPIRFFIGRRGQFALLAARYIIPAIYDLRPFVEAGGLISYGPSLPAVYHQVGAYLPRVLGSGQVMMPADLKRLHKYMLEIEHISVISDEVRAAVAEEWPELAHKLPPKE